MRFCGGAIAPFVAGKLAEHITAQAPFYLGGAMMAIGVGLLFFYRRSLVPARDTVRTGRLVDAAPAAAGPGSAGALGRPAEALAAQVGSRLDSSRDGHSRPRSWR